MRRPIAKWMALCCVGPLLAGCGKKVEPVAKVEPSPKIQPAPTAAAAPPPKVDPKAAAAAQPAAAQPAAAGFHTPIVGALAKAGLKVSEFEQTAARPYNAKTCVQGEVEKLDVLLCSFEGEPAAGEGEKATEQFLGGATTGVVRRRGTVVLGVADRKKTDLRGQQISKLLQAFAVPEPSGAKPAGP